MKIPVSNNTAMSIYVGAAMIPPGETRHFDEEMVPHHLRPAAEEAAAEPEVEPFAALLGHGVKDIAAALPTMETAEIEKLGELEQQGQARKTLLSAIAEELLTRAGNSAPEGNAGDPPIPEGNEG